MKAPDSVKTPDDYLAQVPEQRRDAMRFLHEEIRKAAPGLKPEICAGMIGYGVKPYETPSGCKGVWPVIALASQKRYMSLYVCACGPDGYLAEAAKDRLGKVSVGKSCIRFTKLENLEVGAAMELVRRAVAIEKGGE